MYRAGLPMPGARLLAVAGLVRQGAAVADIGCDHGKLAVYLAKTGRARHVIATDKNPLPLSRAKALVAQTGCGKMVECRLGNGLCALAPGEAQDIVIAGLSGETMVEILQQSGWIRNEELQFIFAPATRAKPLRQWLQNNNFKLLGEIPVEENNKYYSVIHARFSTQPLPPKSPLFYEVGLVPNAHNAAAKGYVQGQLKHLQNCLAAPLPASKQAALANLIHEVETCLKSNKW